MDESRAGSSLGRSPLGDSALAARRPSGNGLSPSPNIGMGLPSTSLGREEWLRDSARQPSAASDYDAQTPRGGRPSSEAVGNGVRSDDNPRRPSMEPTRDEPPDTPRANRVVDDRSRTNGSVTNNQDWTGDSTSTPVPPTSQTAPIITTTLASPSVPQEEKIPTPTEKRSQRRQSFHPAPVDTAFSREVLLTSRTGILPGAAGLTVEADKETADQALLNNVEEMLEGLDWTAGVGNGGKKGSADAIESRLLDELAALDSVSPEDF